MIYFLVPVFNEASNLGRLCNDLLAVLPSEAKHYVFVDDCSTDESVEVIRNSMPPASVTILSNPVNSGPGACFANGFGHILALPVTPQDRVVTMEGDNTCDLQILPLMNALASTWKFDLVLASVYAQGGGFSKTSGLRKTISFVANSVLRSAFDIRVSTLSSFYRVYSISLLQAIRREHTQVVQEPGFICAFELLLKSIHVKAKVIEVPMILHSDRRAGKSKMKVLRTALAYMKFLFRNWRKY